MRLLGYLFRRSRAHLSSSTWQIKERAELCVCPAPCCHSLGSKFVVDSFEKIVKMHRCWCEEGCLRVRLAAMGAFLVFFVELFCWLQPTNTWVCGLNAVWEQISDPFDRRAGAAPHQAAPSCPNRLWKLCASMPSPVVEVFWAVPPCPWAEQSAGNNLVIIMRSSITSERWHFSKEWTSIWKYKTECVSGNSHDANQCVCK